MGDAGPRTPLPEETTPTPEEEEQSQQIREIHVLVTGFGPFKSFNINPSWLIASSLPTELSPLPPPESEPKDSTTQAPPPPQATPIHPHYPSSLLRNQSNQEEPTLDPLRPPTTTPYKIIIHTYPDPVRVAYTPTATLIPSLLTPAAATTPEQRHYDYVFHIGLAGGRDSYTLETLAHREGYTISDVDDGTGEHVSSVWERQDVPQVLHVGWNPQDVLRRWEREVLRRQQQQQEEEPKDEREDKPSDAAQGAETDAVRLEAQQRASSGVREWMASHGMLLRPDLNLNLDLNLGSYMPSPSVTRTTAPAQKAVVVKLSRDAGRFLCEFILMCSLVQRWLDATTSSPSPAPAPAPAPLSPVDEAPQESLGKVAFLHVPNGTEQADVQRGRMVAESAIRSLVASWEGGYRNPIVYSAAAAAAAAAGVGDETLRVKPGAVGVSTEGAAGFEERGTGDAMLPRS